MLLRFVKLIFVFFFGDEPDLICGFSSVTTTGAEERVLCDIFIKDLPRKFSVYLSFNVRILIVLVDISSSATAYMITRLPINPDLKFLSLSHVNIGTRRVYLYVILSNTAGCY